MEHLMNNLSLHKYIVYETIEVIHIEMRYKKLIVAETKEI